MSSRYALLSVGDDRNTPRLADTQLVQFAAGHPEVVNRRPYASRIRRRTTTGGVR